MPTEPPPRSIGAPWERTALGDPKRDHRGQEYRWEYRCQASQKGVAQPSHPYGGPYCSRRHQTPDKEHRLATSRLPLGDSSGFQPSAMPKTAVSAMPIMPIVLGPVPDSDNSPMQRIVTMPNNAQARSAVAVVTARDLSIPILAVTRR